MSYLDTAVKRITRTIDKRMADAAPFRATVTGTDGKTTTTMLTVAMLGAGGVRAIDAGNTDVPLVEAGRRLVLEGGGEDVSTTYRVRHKAGHWLWIEARRRAVRNDAGEPVGDAPCPCSTPGGVQSTSPARTGRS